MTERIQRSRRLWVLADRFAILRLAPDAAEPTWLAPGPLVSVTRTRDELSVLCPEQMLPEEVAARRGLRALRVGGPLAFEEIGVLASLLDPLARAGLSILAVSTYQTDYVLVAEDSLTAAAEVLREAGHQVEGALG